MVKNSSQPNLNPTPSPWQSLPLPQKNLLINLVAELVQRQLTKQKRKRPAQPPSQHPLSLAFSQF